MPAGRERKEAKPYCLWIVASYSAGQSEALSGNESVEFKRVVVVLGSRRLWRAERQLGRLARHLDSGQREWEW